MKPLDEVVYFFSENILVLDPDPNRTLVDLKAYILRLEALLENNTPVYLLLNLSEVGKPDSEMRSYLRKKINEMGDHIIHVTVCSGKNHMINAAMSFIFGLTKFNSFSMHKSIDDCHRKIKRLNGEFA